MFETLKAGCYILAIGMSTVFIFLAIMIYVMEFSAKIIQIINKYWPEEIEEDKYATNNKKKTDNDAEVALAIACALHKGAKC